MSEIIKAGEMAIDFTLPTGKFVDETSGPEMFTLSNHRGKNVILVFYPADWSGVCGDQLILYNEILPIFANYNAELFGISVDGVFCHQAFAEIRNLKMTLISDFEPKGEVSKKYGAYRSKEGFSERALFVIDKDGVVRWSYLSPVMENPGADGILKALKEIEENKGETKNG